MEFINFSFLRRFIIGGIFFTIVKTFQGYKDDMVNPEMQHLIPIQLYGKSDILFGNLEQIYLFHNDVFLRDLENCIDTPELIGLCFVQRVSVAISLGGKFTNWIFHLWV